MKKSNYYVYGSAIISMLFWGMSFVWTAIALRYYNPVTIIFIRLILSSALMFAWIKLFGVFNKIRREDYGLFLISSLFNPFLYFLGENYGVKFTSPTVSAVIIATIPLVVPVMGYFVLKERLSKLNIVGLAISFMGVLIMILTRGFKLETSLIGLSSLLFAVFSAVGYAVYLKKLTLRYSPVFIIAVQNLLGVLYFLPVFLLLDLGHFLSVRPNFELISSIVALAVLCSSLAFVAFTIATKEIGVSKTNVFANLIPVFTGIFSFIVIGEELNSQKILGILIVVAGLFFSQLKKPLETGQFNKY
ncbi:MAG: DMT family transporter [Prolixibacteraceae bacterium]|nr:DMT family transporter [Prolixibacteraceae bacterium]